MWPKGGGRGRGDWGGAGGKTVKIWQDSGLDYTALRCRVLCVQPSQDSDKPKFRDCLPGLKVLSCGWEWGWESLPPSLPPSLPQSVTTMESTALARKELSLPAICKTGAGRGRRGGEVGGGRKGEADCRETAPGTPSPGTWSLGPQTQKRPCPPRGRALSPRPAAALQLCVPRRVGCRISSQALAACSVFPNPPVGEGGSPVRIRVPPPLPLPRPLSQPPFSCPRTFSKLLSLSDPGPCAPYPHLFGFPSSKFRLEGAKWVPQFWRGAGKAILRRPTLRPAGGRTHLSGRAPGPPARVAQGSPAPEWR